MNVHWNREEEPSPSVLIDIVIQLGIPKNLRLEPRKRQEHHHRKALQAHRDLLPYLVLQEPRMFHHRVVKDEIVRKRRKQKVQQMYSHQCRDDEG